MTAPVHLLAVEDDDLVRSVLVRQLDHLGYRTTAVPGADEALEALDAHDDIVLLLTDVRLGDDHDGYGLATESRERHPGLRVVFMSGLTDRRVERFPDAQTLTKPFRQAELVAALETALDSGPA